MSRRRIERVNEQLKREISSILRDDVRDPRVGQPTVTAVEAAPDLSWARVFLNVMGDDDAKAATLEGARAAASFVRSELARRMSVRRVPELDFVLDRSLEHALRIERLLEEVLPPEDDDAS